MNFQDQSELSGIQQKAKGHFVDDQENRQKDFSSVEKLVNLPQMRKVAPYEDLFPPVQNELKDNEFISPDLKNAMIELRQKLRNEFSTFSTSNGFKFNFPESKFPAVEPGKRNMITYEQKNIVEEEDTFRDKLSPQQIQQIAVNGQFKVKSNHEYITLPYVWKVNDALFRGRQNIELSWFKTLALSHSILNNAKQTFLKIIPQQMGKMKKLPSRLFSLFFGKKSMQVTYQVDYPREVGKDFWDQVMTKHYAKSKQWGSDLWEYLDTKYKAEDMMTIRNTAQEQQEDEKTQERRVEFRQKEKKQRQSRAQYQKRVQEKNSKIQKMNQIGDEFQRKWQRQKKKIFQKVSQEQQQQNHSQIKQSQTSPLLKQQQQQQSQQQLLQKLNTTKFQHYTEYLQKKLPQIDIPSNVIEAIVTMLVLMQIVYRKERAFKKKAKEEKERVESQIKAEHKIKQYDYSWYYTQVARLYNPIQKKLYEEYYNKFVDFELIKNLNMKQKQVYNLWLQYRATYDSRVQAKKRQFPSVQTPTRTFYTTYRVLPPYKVVKHTSNNYTWYEMIKSKPMQITTQKNFWKWDLYKMRVKSWTINCVVFLIESCWKGTFGLRCLWGTTEFPYDQYVNYTTGQIENMQRKPVLAVFLTVLDGIKKSRQHFQALPDRGLFGKNFSRYFNYAQCYIFRLLFVGIFLTLILYPIAIMLASLVMFVLIVTPWVWMPIILMVTFLFNTLVFQFESRYIPYGFWIRAAPIWSLIIALVWSLVKILIRIIVLIIIAPLGAFFVALWAVICRGFRTVTDMVMLFLIKKLGRTPSRNTAIAKKISGPGMSKQYYMSINQQDVYILIQSQLQQLFMQQYNRIFQQKVNKPIQRYTKTMQLLLKPYQQNTSYGYNYYPANANTNSIYQSVNELRNLYYLQYNNYMNRYPARPYNIRFTQEEIDSYFDNTVRIVKSFVEKKEIKSWVFDELHVLDGDWDQLTRRVWVRVFNCGEEIFEPLEKIDQRFKLEDMYKSSYQNDDDYISTSSFGGKRMNKNVHKVMEALEGQIDLKPRRANVGHFKHSLLNKEYDSVNIQQVFTHARNNSEGYVFFSLSDPRFLFYVNLAIKEIIKKDTHEYEWKMQDEEKRKQKQKQN